MSDIVRYEPQTGWLSTLEPAANLAAQIANTEFVPGSMRRDPAKVTACILFGQELGLGPMQALAKVDIIDGRPAPKAELARALVLAAGHEIVVESGNTRCTARGRRKGQTEWTEVVWTLDDAKRAGLDGKQNWRKFPRQMLAARATAELARLAFADCLGGVSMFAEELQDDAELAEVPTSGPQGRSKAKGSGRRLNRVEATTEPHRTQSDDRQESDEPPLPDEDIQDAEVVEMITDAQMRKLQATFGDLGIKDRDKRLASVVLIIGREITSSKDLTKDEASKVIDELSAQAEAPFEPATDTEGEQ